MRQSKYVRLPSGLTLTDRFSPILRDAYSLPQSGPPPLPSEGGGLLAPPRMETPIISPSHNPDPGNGGDKSYAVHPAFSPPKGLTYAEFKQIMQNKIVEKLNETPKLVVPPPPESYQSPPPPPAAQPPSPPASSAATVAASVLTTGAPTTAVSVAGKPIE
ncbi:hypothetical protein ANCCAN_21160 [Ancylostoma caninum]|uniref:Uncharacterized protein n=1 Tax=Ancylostoma caninum TaxID=29170 RepID=A0A368FLB6_ANCCA|nr:hypothetical protein ANCCAN_21160 [Ancylostoma caninum]